MGSQTFTFQGGGGGGGGILVQTLVNPNLKSKLNLTFPGGGGGGGELSGLNFGQPKSEVFSFLGGGAGGGGGSLVWNSREWVYAEVCGD